MNQCGSSNWSYTAPCAVPTEQEGEVVWAVNCGGARCVEKEILFLEDELFTGGRGFARAASSCPELAETIFCSERYGDFSYQVPVTEGTYRIRLSFCELFFTTAGKRVFNVFLNNELRCADLDIVGQAGKGRPLQQEFFISPADGLLLLQVCSKVNNGSLCAIELRRE